MILTILVLFITPFILSAIVFSFVEMTPGGGVAFAIYAIISFTICWGIDIGILINHFFF
ncbi:MAG: hypothetical protein GY861_02905 [bacterium]|nr:hypothetical protein [bacterium]